MHRRTHLSGLITLCIAALSTDFGVRAAEGPPPAGAVKPVDRPMGPDREALAAIVRPTQWTPDEVDRYIAEIIEVSSRTFHVFENDPQVQMLSAVGPGNIATLFKALGKARGVADAHLERAIQQVIQDSHRDLLLAYLPHHPRLASIVVTRGWEKDAHDILMDGLQRDLSLGGAWLRAVVSLNDPRAPEALRRYMAGSGDPVGAYGALKALNYRDLNEAVLETWRALQVDRQYLMEHFATVAARHGVVEALELIARAVESRRPTLLLPEMEQTLIELVPYEGSAQEVAAFVLENRDRIRFDARLRRYSLE